MPPKKGTASSSATGRAASLLAKARAAAAVSSPGPSSRTPKRETPAAASSSSLPGNSSFDDFEIQQSDEPNDYVGPSSAASGSDLTPVPLPQLLKQLTSRGFTMHEAMPIAGKIIKGGFAIAPKLALLSPAALEGLGVEGDDTRRKVIAAFATQKRNAGSSGSSPSKRRRRADDDDVLSREWGNVPLPGSSSGKSLSEDYAFHEVLVESEVAHRYVYVNRAPVMTAWATIVAERLGFNRREALSVAHCYVAYTSTSRGISIGVIPASERDRSIHVVGRNQPHFELMGVKIPVMQTAGGEWRGISGGESIGPEKAFTYMRTSMFQTLPLVIGALTLLADSFMDPPPTHSSPATALKQEGVKNEADVSSTPDPAADSSEYGAEVLHAEAYNLYTLFRPETGGRWGKRARFELGKVLALRKGREAEWQKWVEMERKREKEEAEGLQIDDDELEQAAGDIQSEGQEDGEELRFATSKGKEEGTSVKTEPDHD